MKAKIIIFILLITGASAGSYYYYQYNYVETLMLSEIVGKTDNSLANIAVSLFDFDTGLTRNDLHQLVSKKDYWIDRMKNVETIQDPKMKSEANIQLLSDMMEDPAMRKVGKNITSIGLSFAINILEVAE